VVLWSGVNIIVLTGLTLYCTPTDEVVVLPSQYILHWLDSTPTTSVERQCIVSLIRRPVFGTFQVPEDGICALLGVIQAELGYPREVTIRTISY